MPSYLAFFLGRTGSYLLASLFCAHGVSFKESITEICTWSLNPWPQNWLCCGTWPGRACYHLMNNSESDNPTRLAAFLSGTGPIGLFHSTWWAASLLTKRSLEIRINPGPIEVPPNKELISLRRHKTHSAILLNLNTQESSWGLSKKCNGRDFVVEKNQVRRSSSLNLTFHNRSYRAGSAMQALPRCTHYSELHTGTPGRFGCIMTTS